MPSIAGRLGRQVLLISLCWALLAGVLVWAVVQEEVDELLDETMQASSQVLGQLLRDRPPEGGAVADDDDLSTHFSWQLVRGDGSLLFRSPLAPSSPWRLPVGFSDWNGDAASSPPHAALGHGSEHGSHDGDWRVLVRPFKTRYVDGWLIVAQTSAERREVRDRVGMASALSALLVGGFCMVWLNRRARRELEPLSDMTRALAQYDPLDSRQSLPEQHRQELAAIRSAVLDLGHRLAQRVANERAFSAHAAHALRTPLAGMDAQLAVALREAPEGQRERLQRTREATDRLRRVVTALLTLFRTGMSLQWQSLDVNELLGHLPLPDGLVLDLPEEGRVQADPDLLAAALINLLDNACRHRATRVTLRIRSSEGGGCELALEDNGDGVDADKRDDLNAALASQQYEGRMGLGLMMAHLVARAHGGDLVLPRSELGFAVSMRLGPAPAGNEVVA
ncbi:HAMP domain-containing sensor histidine kinase [Roseateles sp.]|uniref:sensor histidine kinase n=1 Tax=Roseateles sp. TaxID=1971397 RepID=UPI002F417813